MFVIEDYIFILQTICAAGTNYVIAWSVTSIQAELFEIFLQPMENFISSEQLVSVIQ